MRVGGEATALDTRTPPHQRSRRFSYRREIALAGGLDACRKLLDALPAVNGMAFIIVQHLDPSHDSMMADLLAGHTSMPVLLATDGMKIEREHVYVIPPGVYLSVNEKGGLRLSKPLARHGARLPFDFLMKFLGSRI